jgi:hypothetical protein
MAGRRQENQRWVVLGLRQRQSQERRYARDYGAQREILPRNNKEVAKNYIMFAAGVASRPFCLSSKPIWHRAQQHFSVVLFNLRSVKSIIFKEEIELLKNKYFGVLKFSIS